MHDDKNPPAALINDLHTAMQRLVALTPAASLMDRMNACMEMVTAESKATLAISQWDETDHTDARYMLAEITRKLAPHPSPTLEHIAQTIREVAHLGAMQDN